MRQFVLIMIVAGKQAGGMAIFAHAQQYHVKGQGVGNDFPVSSAAGSPAQFGRNGKNLRCGNRHFIQKSLAGHHAVSVRMVGRQTAFIAIINHPFRPVRSASANKR